MSLTWRDALKQFNDERKANGGGKYTIPKIGTPEYDQVKALQNAPLKQNIVKSEPRSKSRTPPKENKATNLSEMAPEEEKVKMVKNKTARKDAVRPVEADAAPKTKKQRS